MILLDTNVISEAMKPAPEAAVRDWLDEQAAETLYLSSVTIAELTFGIGALPQGRRKNRLTAALEGVMAMFGERILPFDTEAARRYGDLAVRARAAGRRFPTPDGYIAAIAAAHDFAVASRDASAFEAAGLAVINSWTKTTSP
jgi:predicted nucleic acid-binding protein